MQCPFVTSGNATIPVSVCSIVSSIPAALAGLVDDDGDVTTTAPMPPMGGPREGLGVELE